MKKTIRLTEKKFLETINRLVNEAPINYGDYPERMDPKTEKKLGDPESAFAKAFRGGSADIEGLAGERFKKVVDKLKSVTGIDDLSSKTTMMMLMQEMMGYIPRIIDIESRHKEELEELAKKAAIEMTEIDEDWFNIESELNRGSIETNDFKFKEDEKPKFEIPSTFDAEELTDEENFELEKAKRNLINSIIQGTAKKGHYIFQKPNIKEELDGIDPSLYMMYSKVMAINDMMYFTMEDLIEMANERGDGVAAKVTVTDNKGGGEDGDDEGSENEGGPDTTIKAEGLIFPMLCHEIIKGIEEAKGRHGLPSDEPTSRKVMGQTDIFSNEPMQLRIGPELVEKIRFALPAEIFEPENKGLINWFQTELYKLPAKEFLDTINNINSKNDSENRKGLKTFNELLKIAKKNKQEYDQSKGSDGNENNNEDDFDAFLKDMGL